MSLASRERRPVLRMRPTRRSENSMDLLPIEESACYRPLRHPRIGDSETLQASRRTFWWDPRGRYAKVRRTRN